MIRDLETKANCKYFLRSVYYDGTKFTKTFYDLQASLQELKNLIFLREPYSYMFFYKTKKCSTSIVGYSIDLEDVLNGYKLSYDGSLLTYLTDPLTNQYSFSLCGEDDLEDTVISLQAQLIFGAEES